VCVIGTPGVGKTWLAVRLAAILDVPHIDLDAFKLQPERKLASPEELTAAVSSVITTDRWLLDGNWNDDELADLAWSRAEALVWVDYPRWQVMAQVGARSVWWALTRHEHHGWRERPSSWFSPNRPIRRSWKMHAGYRRRYSSMIASRADLTTVRLASRSQARRLLASPPLATKR